MHAYHYYAVHVLADDFILGQGSGKVPPPRIRVQSRRSHFIPPLYNHHL